VVGQFVVVGHLDQLRSPLFGCLPHPGPVVATRLVRAEGLPLTGTDKPPAPEFTDNRFERSAGQSTWTRHMEPRRRTTLPQGRAVMLDLVDSAEIRSAAAGHTDRVQISPRPAHPAASWPV
jgi:hypothetical protein